jgi:hypothetical protein
MDEGVTPTGMGVIRGRFLGEVAFGEPSATLFGPGTLEVTDAGLHLVAQHTQFARRAWTIVASLTVATMGGVGLGAAVGAASAWGFVALCAAAAVLVWRRWCRAAPYDRVVPWSEVERAGVSDGALMFGLQSPRRGAARFQVPGYGLRELRPLAQELTRRGRRP